MKTLRAKLIALLLAAASVTGIGLAIAAPAQAFTSFTYVADCPGSARYQQLVFQNYSGASQSVDVETPLTYLHTLQVANWDYGHGGPGQDTSFPEVGAITYWDVQWSDIATYHVYGSGSLNWYYHVDCFY